MGIQDRDYYRESASARHKTPASSTRRIAFLWILIGVLLFVAIRALSPAVPVRPATASRSTDVPARSEPPPSIPIPPATRLPAPFPADRGSASGAAPIYRCGNSYSQSPCANGRVVGAPAASGFESRPSQAYVDLVARGRSSDTGTSTTVTSTVTTVNGVDVGNGGAAECRQLADELVLIDQAARQPRSMPEQDRLRTQRRRASDRRAALHC